MSYSPSTHLFEVTNEAYSAVISMIALLVCLLYTFIKKCVKMEYVRRKCFLQCMMGLLLFLTPGS